MTDTALIEEMRKAKVRLQGISISGEMDIAVVDHAKASLSEGIKALEQSDAEIARLLAVEAAAKDAINQCFCIAPENTIKCECCKAEAETLKDFPHKPTCPVLVINPIEE